MCLMARTTLRTDASRPARSAYGPTARRTRASVRPVLVTGLLYRTMMYVLRMPLVWRYDDDGDGDGLNRSQETDESDWNSGIAKAGSDPDARQRADAAEEAKAWPTPRYVGNWDCERWLQGVEPASGTKHYPGRADAEEERLRNAAHAYAMVPITEVSLYRHLPCLEPLEPWTGADLACLALAGGNPCRPRPPLRCRPAHRSRPRPDGRGRTP